MPATLKPAEIKPAQQVTAPWGDVILGVSRRLSVGCAKSSTRRSKVERSSPAKRKRRKVVNLMDACARAWIDQRVEEKARPDADRRAAAGQNDRGPRKAGCWPFQQFAIPHSDLWSHDVDGLLPGTLDAYSEDPQPRSHARYAVAGFIQQASGDALRVELYPALHRLELRGWLRSEWGTSDNNRRAKLISADGAWPARTETKLPSDVVATGPRVSADRVIANAPQARRMFRQADGIVQAPLPNAIPKIAVAH